jgi:hypothetical protein
MTLCPESLGVLRGEHQVALRILLQRKINGRGDLLPGLVGSSTRRRIAANAPGVNSLIKAVVVA